LDETLNEILDEGYENNEDNKVNETDENNDECDNEHENLNSEFIKSTEIQYILENNGPINIRLSDNELKELIFRKDDIIDVY